MHSLNESIVLLEKLLRTTNNYSIYKEKYIFNNDDYKKLSKKIVFDNHNLSIEDEISDELLSELFKTFYEENKKNSFEKIINFIKNYKQTYFTINFYNDAQKEYFLSQATEYIINNLVTIDNFNAYLYQVDKDLETIFKEQKKYKWNATLPENTPNKFNNLTSIYSFFENNMDLEHLNSDSHIVRDSLLYVILENEEKNIYYYSSEKTFTLTQSVLNKSIESDDIFMIDKIIHTFDIKFNCFLLNQTIYYHFAFVNLVKQFNLHNTTKNYESKVYETILDILVDVLFENYHNDCSLEKNNKLYFFVDFILNWKNELHEYLKESVQKKLRKIDIEDIVRQGIDEHNISFLYFILTTARTMSEIDKKTLETIASSVIESFMKSYEEPFSQIIYKKFDFKIIFHYTEVDNFKNFCKELVIIKNDTSKYRMIDYFEVLFSLYSKELESDIIDIVLGFAKTEYGLNLGIISKDKFISLLNFFEMDNFEKVIKELNSVDDLLQIYSILLDSAKRNIVAEKLKNITLSIFNKESIFLAQQLGFDELSTNMEELLKDDEISKFVKYKIQLFKIFNDETISKDEKFEKFNSFTFDIKNYQNKQYCQFYKSFLHTILNFEKSPKYVYDTLKKLFDKSPQHLYLINIASAYIEFVKDDENKIEKLTYFIDEFKSLHLELKQEMITQEYEILLFLYNETSNYIEFEKLWKTLKLLDRISLNIVKIRVDFLIKKLQSTEAMNFLSEVEKFYYDVDAVNEIKDLKVAIKSGTKNQLKSIGMRFEEVIKEDSMYDVALSFAGEQREYVEKVAKFLKEKQIDVFYDDYEKADLWGKNLFVHLDEIYSRKAKFVIMFLSKEYAEKLWTNHERESSQEKAFKEKKEYILPVKFDNTKIPGVRDTTGYLDANSHSPEEIVELFIKKFYGE